MMLRVFEQINDDDDDDGDDVRSLNSQLLVTRELVKDLINDIVRRGVAGPVASKAALTPVVLRGIHTNLCLSLFLSTVTV